MLLLDEKQVTHPLTVGQATDPGRKKPSNQDAIAVVHGSDLHHKIDALLVVADGHGPAGIGEEVSAVTVQTITTRFDEILQGDGMPDLPWLERALRHCVERANIAVRANRQDNPSKEEVGTTCTIAIVSEGNLVIGSVGDSRCYLIRDREMEQLTNDHAIIRQSESGIGTFLGRAIGWEPTVEVECSTQPLEPGDIVLLASDGLNRMLPDSDVLRVALKHPDPGVFAAQLVQTANARGGYDNISVVAVRYGAEVKPSRPDSPLRRLFSRRA
jgi:protein phosphatase